MSIPEAYRSPLRHLLRQAQRARVRIVRFFVEHHLSENSFILVLAVLIGLAGGLGAVGFRWLIDIFSDLFLVRGTTLLGHPYLLPVIPAIGGLLVGIIVLRWAPEARGHGVPEVMAAVATEGGRIRPRVVIIKSLASAICIGSGGSVGREGPIVQIGSAFGSSVGQLFGFSQEKLKVLVGCGAAAGISATFNAPLAGGVFALEVILGDFSVNTFSPIVLSSVIATALTHYMTGSEPAFLIPKYELVGGHELLGYGVLAVLAGCLAVGFTRCLYLLEDWFDRIPISDYAKPVVGGLAIGTIGILYPQVFGVGYDTITESLLGRLDLMLLAGLLLAKFLATNVTLGSGGSGGIFAPALFMGAMFGGVFGHLLQAIFPGSVGEPGAYALVGMGAVVAGTTHAPMASMLILFEMTDDYQIILPLMLATVVSTLTAKRIYKESIYTLKLSRRGLRLARGLDVSVLDSIRVREVMNVDHDFVKVQTPLGDIVALLQNGELTDFPVVDDAGDLQGIVSFQDIRSVMGESEVYPLLIAADAMNGESPSVGMNATLTQAMESFAEADVDAMPVVGQGQKLVGVLTRSSLMDRYHQELKKRTEA